MSAINIGNITNATFKVGGADCSIYLGSVKLYPQEEPPTPVFGSKYKFTLSDSSVVSAECDASSSITTADTSAYKTTVTDAIIGDCVTSLWYAAFSGCTNLSSLTIPDSVTTIESSVFHDCSGMTSITIPNSVTSMGDNVFDDCSSLTSVIIGSGVTSIGMGVFKGCSRLTSVIIPNSVKSIGGFAFSGCSSLTSITVKTTTPPTLSISVFVNTNDCPIYVPSESVEEYKAAEGWSDYASRIQAIP